MSEEFIECFNGWIIVKKVSFYECRKGWKVVNSNQPLDYIRETLDYLDSLEEVS